MLLVGGSTEERVATRRQRIDCVAYGRARQEDDGYPGTMARVYHTVRRRLLEQYGER
jgi:hypothetical protein